MKRGVPLAAGLLCLASLSAQADDKKPTPEELVKAMIQNLNEISDIVATITNDASADQAIAKLKKTSNLERLGKAFFSLPKEQREKLEETYKGDMEMASKKLQEAFKKMEGKVSRAKGEEIIKAIGGLYKRK